VVSRYCDQYNLACTFRDCLREFGHP
jgi:hypothetical protein